MGASLWVVQPRSVLVVVPPLIHLAIGVGLGVLGGLVRAIDWRVVVALAVAINGVATVIENGQGAGVVGVLWWLLGTAISAALMLVGAAVRRVADTGRHRRVSVGRP